MNSSRSRDGQQIEKLAGTPSNWRILNLNRELRHLRQVFGPSAPTFFRNKRLASSIVIKHTLRDHERAMFENAPVLATKILVPLDENSLSSGAISFFVGERAYPAIMRQSFGVNVVGHGAQADRDAMILSKLNATPSLDLFLLREMLGAEEFGIPKDYFQVSLLEDAAIKSYITRELTPLIRIAIENANAAKVNKFVDSIFGAEIGPQAADFFQSLGLMQNQWSNIVFAWKAALFYETQFVQTRKRFQAMLGQLTGLRTYGHNELYPRSFVEKHLEDLRAFADRAFRRSIDSAQCFNSERRASIIEGKHIGALKTYLEELPENVHGFGGYNALIDHVLSYWNFRTSGLDHTRLPAELFCKLAADICSMENQFSNSEATRMSLTG
ncbi:hypothetical protein sos41_02950 [Alphaproteobacteria bacterium SO-S41]|nr:hypothetical protein sos41_02950 [Alphaproteobacteria bacterium SO-S41]